MAPSKQCTAIAQALHDLDHPTADEVFMTVRQALPRISLATVYRNLDAMAARGEVRLRRIGQTKRYDPVTHDHAHLHCTACHRLIDIDHDATALSTLDQAATDAGFTIHDHLIEIHGLCPDCQAKHDDRPRATQTAQRP